MESVLRERLREGEREAKKADKSNVRGEKREG